jgi:hypothetical protein
MSESPILRTALRVTKYDPALRDERGGFTGDDWTSVSDVGGLFSGRVLTLQTTSTWRRGTFVWSLRSLRKRTLMR